jgi:FkbM family methyltransferase
MGLRSRLETVWRNKFSPMRMIKHSHLTCSQYAEDIVFRRLFRPSNSGFYVDVGAHHPIDGSNSFSLYAHGWRGLTVDPNPRFANLFKKARPRDVHLVEGVASESSNIIYYQFSHDVFNTFSEERALALAREGNQIVKESVVSCRPLAQMGDEYFIGRQIDLLNVDCEGFDLSVISSIDLTVRRPTVIIVEDYKFLSSLQGKGENGDVQGYLRDHCYTPVAQSAWSTIMVADDWSDLIRRSGAYSAEIGRNGYLP